MSESIHTIFPNGRIVVETQNMGQTECAKVTQELRSLGTITSEEKHVGDPDQGVFETVSG